MSSLNGDSRFEEIKLRALSCSAYFLLNLTNYSYRLQVINLSLKNNADQNKDSARDNKKGKSQNKMSKSPRRKYTSEKENLKRGLYCVWHRYIWTTSFYFRNRDFFTLASRSGDGEFISRVLKKMGYNLIRGSSSRGGVGSLRKLYRVLQQGNRVIVTPDGPRGPARNVKPGVIYLQEKTGVDIFPVGLAVKHKKVFDSWDRFVLPCPFSRIVLVIGKSINFLESETVEDRKQLVEKKLQQVNSRAREELAGNHCN